MTDSNGVKLGVLEVNPSMKINDMLCFNLIVISSLFNIFLGSLRLRLHVAVFTTRNMAVFATRFGKQSDTLV